MKRLLLLTPSINSRNEDHRPVHEIEQKEKELYKRNVNPHLLFADIKSHGYYVARIDEKSFKAGYYFIDNLYSRTANERKAASFEMSADDFILRESQGG